MVSILTENRVAESFGGECHWGLQACDDWDTKRGFSIGEDGFRTSWITIANRLRASVECDLDGWPYLEHSVERMTLNEASSLPPLPQLAVRARIMLGTCACTRHVRREVEHNSRLARCSGRKLVRILLTTGKV